MFEGGGNVPLITPVVAAMVERGHDVAVVAGPNIRRPEPGLPSDGFCDRIRGAGAHVVPLLDTPIDPLAGYTAPAAIFGRTPDNLTGAVDAGRIARWSRPWAERVAAEVADRRPDALVGDFFLFGALAAGESARLPTAALVHNGSVNWPLPGLPLPPPGSLPMRGPAGWSRDKAWAVTYNRVARREGQRFVNEARTLLGLHPLRRLHEQVERADRVLVMSSRAFELPLRGPLPENVRHVGAILTARPETSWRPPEDDGRPLVLVSLSTLPQGQGPVMRRVLEAMSTLPVRAVVTLGPALAKETFDIPANVHVEAFVPHELVLPHVSAVVTQCGLSTITKVLAAGLPMVGLPVLGDQPANAARIVAAGAGLRLPKEASATTIGEAVRRILDDSRFRRSAGRFAAVLANQNPADLIVTELENLLGRTTMTLE
jgi:UDP:flavonoid glycosyltransferase YjiC (YdhE family)